MSRFTEPSANGKFDPDESSRNRKRLMRQLEEKAKKATTSSLCWSLIVLLFLVLLALMIWR